MLLSRFTPYASSYLKSFTTRPKSPPPSILFSKDSYGPCMLLFEIFISKRKTLFMRGLFWLIPADWFLKIPILFQTPVRSSYMLIFNTLSTAFKLPWATKSGPWCSLWEKNNGPLVGYYATKYWLLLVVNSKKHF